MITSKQRSYLRSLGHNLEPIFQVGKGGLEEGFLKQIDDALEAREIIKISVLNNSGYEAREASDAICSELNCEGVQAIGNKIVLYRKSEKKQKIQLP
ncbi:ribosome assembly RNA-binding protein YhbY [Clostridium sp. YIM B02515]|uniref:Ribosome assembly RNA-binding protein YhbY n=1 Tax=Clostridium rhizosphaerae TaxID=2803861 RepID=A0ABS1T781_9CLOT|nr:ribosome assembly RNA-binding protein YhbY [Clostridium rhizosphaerae]MBL4935203.1 ribosome assembly RNA-binding protein YhbY [Clostridium rhizosphaerae]